MKKQLITMILQLSTLEQVIHMLLKMHISMLKMKLTKLKIMVMFTLIEHMPIRVLLAKVMHQPPSVKPYMQIKQMVAKGTQIIKKKLGLQMLNLKNIQMQMVK